MYRGLRQWDGAQISGWKTGLDAPMVSSEHRAREPLVHPRLYALSCQMQPPRIRFTPVLLKSHHDGWTPARQLHFIEQLAVIKSVTRACKAVGMSSVTAYALRKKPGAESFAAAWDVTLTFVPDPDRRRSPSAVQRLARLAARRKANEAPNARPPVSPSRRHELRGLKTLEALLGQLRSHEQA